MVGRCTIIIIFFYYYFFFWGGGGRGEVFVYLLEDFISHIFYITSTHTFTWHDSTSAESSKFLDVYALAGSIITLNLMSRITGILLQMLKLL